MSGGRRWGGSESFSDLLGRGQNFSISHHEKCIAFWERGCLPSLPLLLQFSDYFLYSLKTFTKITPRFLVFGLFSFKHIN